MEIHFKIAGILLIALSLIHIAFPKYFGWLNELKQLSLINRQMMYVHTFFVAFVVLLMGLLCVTSAQQIIHTTLGNRLAFGLGCFWVIRLFVQFFIYSPKLWRGKKFETTIHILFSLLWAYLSAVFFAACLS